jgi:hypothetical protein
MWRKQMNKAVYILSAMIGLSASYGLTLGSAEASSLVRECRAGSAGQVVACCEGYVREHGRPFWMRTADASCQELKIKCSGSKGNKTCAPVRITHIDQNGDRPDEGGKNPGGGKNPNGGNNPSRSISSGLK